MEYIVALWLAAAAAVAQSEPPKQPGRDLAAERQQAVELLKRSQTLASPNDATVQGWLAYCLFAKSKFAAGPGEVASILKRADQAALRAKELGSTWPLLNDLLAVLETPGAAQQPYSSNAGANSRMVEGEAAFGRGDNQAALAAYAAALKLDPKLYAAAVFSGDICFREKNVACAAEWYGKAVAIDPERETAYRYWGDALMSAGRMLEARDKFIEALLAEPGQKPWAALANWAGRNNCELTAPKIERPRISDDPQPAAKKAQDVAGQDKSGQSSWGQYAATRAAWRQGLFAKNYPNEPHYRHTLAEEAAALIAVADAVEKLNSNQLDGQLANLLALKKDGLVEAWILLNGGPDPGISQDYPGYRRAHHDQLRAYLDMYIIHPKH